MKIHLLLLIVVALMLAGCGPRTAATADPALVEFVVGAWVYPARSSEGIETSGVYDGGPDASMQYAFEQGTTAWLSTGEVGSQCTYAFAGADVIRLQCEPDQFDARALRVKMEGASLVIQELDEKLSPLGAPRRFVKVGG